MHLKAELAKREMFTSIALFFLYWSCIVCNIFDNIIEGGPVNNKDVRGSVVCSMYIDTDDSQKKYSLIVSVQHLPNSIHNIFMF